MQGSFVEMYSRFHGWFIDACFVKEKNIVSLFTVF